MTSWHQSQVTTRVLLRMSYPRGPTNGSVCTTWSVGSSNGRSSRASHRRFRWVQVAQAKPFSSNQAVISASGALGEVVIQKQRLLKQNNINLIYILYIHDSIKNLIKLTNKQRVKQTRIDSGSPAMPEPATAHVWIISCHTVIMMNSTIWYKMHFHVILDQHLIKQDAARLCLLGVSPMGWMARCPSSKYASSRNCVDNLLCQRKQK